MRKRVCVCVMGPLCDPSWGKHGIGIAGDTNPDVLWTGGSGLFHLWDEGTEAVQRREHPASVHPRLSQPSDRRTLAPRPSSQFLHGDK